MTWFWICQTSIFSLCAPCPTTVWSGPARCICPPTNPTVPSTPRCPDHAPSCDPVVIYEELHGHDLVHVVFLPVTASGAHAQRPRPSPAVRIMVVVCVCV